MERGNEGEAKGEEAVTKWHTQLVRVVVTI